MENAIRNNDMVALKFCVEHGADVHETDNYGFSSNHKVTGP